MKRFLPLILILILLLIDISILPALVIHWAVPLITYTGVIVIGLLLGRTRGLLYGMIAGLLLDIAVSTPLGFQAVAYLLAGYIAGIAGRRFQRYLLTPVLTPVALLVAYELAMAFYLYLAGARLGPLLLRNALVRVGIETVLAQIMYLLFNRLLKPTWSRYASR